MPGMFIRAIAIMAPGMFLSQPPTHTTPSIDSAPQAVSIASAMTSRETSEYFIPSVPIEMPSLTVMVPNICGMPPSALTASSALCASTSSPALQGVIVLYPLAMPTIGLVKSSSPKPTARSIARLGERWTPWVMSWERRLSKAGKRERGKGNGRRENGRTEERES